jgi:hypothetical protein
MKFLYRVFYHREIKADSQEEADDLVSQTPLPDDYVSGTQESILLGITLDDNSIDDSSIKESRYFDEWSENTETGWWNEGRKKLNVIIRMVNEWTLGGCPSDRVEVLLRHIEMGLQTFAARDGGSGWEKELIVMRQYIEGRVRGFRHE